MRAQQCLTADNPRSTHPHELPAGTISAFESRQRKHLNVLLADPRRVFVVYRIRYVVYDTIKKGALYESRGQRSYYLHMARASRRLRDHRIRRQKTCARGIGRAAALPTPA